MKQTSGPAWKPAEAVGKDIRRATRRQFSAEEKIRIPRGQRALEMRTQASMSSFSVNSLGATAMTGFGDWLSKTTLNLEEINFLQGVASNVGTNWPSNSLKKLEYENAINQSANVVSADKPKAVSAFYRLWEIFDLDTRPKNTKVGFWDRFTISAPTLAVVAPGGILLIIFCVALVNTNISNVDGARGIITLLFSVTTVGIAIIVTLSNFLGSIDAQEADKRFQRGKDILTVLIGVFGALLGYYFGTDKNGSQTPLKNNQQSAQETLAADKPSVTPAPKTNQRSGQGTPAADGPPVKDATQSR